MFVLTNCPAQFCGQRAGGCAGCPRRLCQGEGCGRCGRTDGAGGPQGHAGEQERPQEGGGQAGAADKENQHCVIGRKQFNP